MNAMATLKTKTTMSSILFMLLVSMFGCKSKNISVLREPILGMDFIQIKKGSFLMGDHEKIKDSEIVHEVNITYDYWLGKTEVTQAQWQSIMGNKMLHPEKPSPFHNVNLEYPIVSVSYYDIEVFLDSLNV